jgi:hypothetical protein
VLKAGRVSSIASWKWTRQAFTVQLKTMDSVDRMWLVCEDAQEGRVVKKREKVGSQRGKAGLGEPLVLKVGLRRSPVVCAASKRRAGWGQAPVWPPPLTVRATG